MSAIDGQVNRGALGLPFTARVPPQLYFVGAAVFHYLGPAFAVLLFARVPSGGVAWLRIVSAGLVFAVWRRPWRVFRPADSRTRRLIIGLGAVFACMNYAFYAAIDRLPLGTVAAIEFLGPLLLALLGLRSPRNLAALAIAVVGVCLLSEVRLEGSADGFLWAFANAALFTLYIHLAHQLARSDPRTAPIDRLGGAMLVAALVITPLGIGAALPALRDPVALAGGIGVGLSSSVIPYVLDQLAMTRISRSTYSLFVALLPATAVLIAVLVLHQVPTPLELFAVGLIIGAVLIHREARHSS
jgi:inner membrane transporter RhtA